jgi:flagellar biosynthesis/type III secretory pathway protein FliH
MADLEEVRSMLAERVKEWTQEWKQEGFQEGLENSLDKARAAFLRKLEMRFGSLPQGSRQKVESLDSIETIVELSSSIATAPSLAALGLA